ncbi:unnamed protein product, partial [Didymodactylos carnosus]
KRKVKATNLIDWRENFGISPKELDILMRSKEDEAYNLILTEHGGIKHLCQKLHSNSERGLENDPEDLQLRQIVYGKNEIPPKPAKSFLRLCWEAAQDRVLLILMIAAVVSIVLSIILLHTPQVDADSFSDDNEWLDGVAICLAIFIVITVTALNDWHKEKQFRSLQNRIDKDHLTTVVRAGDLTEIVSNQLVVGDVCVIKYGDNCPADGIVLFSTNLEVDESTLTGETDMISKSTRNPILLSGTRVMDGNGKMLVTAVGLNSQTGKIMTLLGAAEKEDDGDESEADSKQINIPARKGRSVLQGKLLRLAIQISVAGISTAILCFILLTTRYSLRTYHFEKKAWQNSQLQQFVRIIVQSLTVIVVCVPEGLPLAVTIALAYAVRQMVYDNNYVRHLHACETMGNATTICSDKTGTITTNRMTAVECFFAGQHITQILNDRSFNYDLTAILFEAISINSSYTSKIEVPTRESELPRQLGNKTECGLLGLVQTFGGHYNLLRQKYPEEDFIKVYSFNSKRKLMATVIRRENTFRLFVKGASEVILDKCDYVLDQNNTSVALNSDFSEYLEETVIKQMASRGLRTIAVAYRDLVVSDGSIRGIFIVLYKIQQDKLDKIWPKLRVLARSTPEDKFNLVNGIVESRITRHREVVAVTGQYIFL